MRNILLAASAVLALGAGGAHAKTISDPVGDYIPSFVGPTPQADLDITSFSVSFDDVASTFDFSATFAGPLNSSNPNLYVIGVDTGKGAIRPFANIGEGNVAFDQAILVRESGTGSVGAQALSPTFTSNGFDVVVPLAFLPSTGVDAFHYQFNLWSRIGLSNNNQNADFAPDNALTGVPEPATWALMITGFGLAGASVRGRRRVRAA